MKSIFLLAYFLHYNSANPIDWRIVGGSTASLGQFPFIVSLRTPSDSHNCGGSILNQNWIVTAAHCVDGITSSYYTIVMGTNQLNDTTNAIRKKVSKIIIHPEWNSYKIQNDVALLELEDSINFTDLVQPISLEDQYNDDNRDCTIAGWGRLNASGIIPNDLQFLNSEVLEIQKCKDAWNANQVFDSQICTYTKNGEGACYGDSGGPLIAQISNKIKLIGLVSWGSPCARGLPDVFTRVSTFSDWILNNISTA